mmetsp:Transcript_21523/g.49343  ORF Transcript_21523/g.49343 Transcript_21523/m.49343 type:complete len:222 (-) Transcript_21523:184-849(-)
MAKQQNQLLTSVVTASLFCLPIFYITRRQRRRQQERLVFEQERAAERQYLTDLVLSPRSQPLKPPLPPVVKKVLSRCRLAYLSTVDSEIHSSHLSLMRFTYLPEEELIIMSTNRMTKKYDMISRQKGVALLIHDFADEGGADRLTGEFSITMNGTCSVVGDVVLADRYRQAHLKNNPDYPQFIVGQHIAILAVCVTSARICNINDEVIKWTSSRNIDPSVK